MSDTKQRICEDCKKELAVGENRKHCKACGKACCHGCIQNHRTPNAVAKQRTR